MSALQVLAESLRLLRAQRVYTLLVSLMCTVCVFAGIAASGQGIANERRVLASIDSANTTTIVVRDIDGGAELSAVTVERIAGLAHVDWAVGLGPALDAANARLDTPSNTPVKVVVGMSPVLQLRGGSDRIGAWVSPGAVGALHLASPSGAIRRSDGREYAVLGEFSASEPLTRLNGLALIFDADDQSWLSEIVISVDEPGAVIAVGEAARVVAGQASPTSISIESPEVLAEVREVVAGDLRAEGRRSVVAVLLVSSVVIAVVTFAAVSARRRDFGRRRALGARRSNLVLLIVGHVVFASLIGSVVGVLAGAYVVRMMTGEPVDLLYPIAVATLTILTSATASFVPAVIAAVRDPLAVLRSA